jgi:hypothetical protein
VSLIIVISVQLKCQHVISFDNVVAKTDGLSQIYYANPVIVSGDRGYGPGDRVSIPDRDRDILVTAARLDLGPMQ